MSICVLLNRPCFGCWFQCLFTKPCLVYSQRNSRISFQCVIARMLLFMMMTNMLLACLLCSCYVYIPLVERVGSHSLYLLMLGRQGNLKHFLSAKTSALANFELNTLFAKSCGMCRCRFSHQTAQKSCRYGRTIEISKTEAEDMAGVPISKIDAQQGIDRDL